MLSALFAALALSSVSTVEIDLSERDLIEPARVETLRAEIRRAARDVCGVRTTRMLAERRQALACAAEAEARGNAQLSLAVARAGTINVAAGR
ncbi:MAG: UrcA family protein [Oceanicaulis sp.]